jgi:hypothetical protein
LNLFFVLFNHLGVKLKKNNMPFYKAAFVISGKDHEGDCSGEDAEDYDDIDVLSATLFVKTPSSVDCTADLTHKRIGCTSDGGSGYCTGFEQHYECTKFTRATYYPNKFAVEYHYNNIVFFMKTYCDCLYYPTYPRKCGKCVGELVESFVQLPECLTHIVMQYAGHLNDPRPLSVPKPIVDSVSLSVPKPIADSVSLSVPKPIQTKWTKIWNILESLIEALTVIEKVEKHGNL